MISKKGNKNNKNGEATTSSTSSSIAGGIRQITICIVVFVIMHEFILEDPRRSQSQYQSQSTTITTNNEATPAAPAPPPQQQQNQKDGVSCYPSRGLHPLKDRDELGALAEEFNFTTGIEIGVQKGHFSKEVLEKWKSCTTYYLVDLWAQQQNYKDGANVNNDMQENFYQQTHQNLAAYSSKTVFYRMLSTEAAAKFEKESIDFIYVDARHDYCGVLEDLEHYWPILKKGGIMAGHDFMENKEVPAVQKGREDWGLCGDGVTRNEMAVKGAVNDFFVPKGLTISVTYRQKWPLYHSWFVQKPLC